MAAKSIKELELTAIGQNIGANVEGNYLHIVIRTDQTLGESKTGKSELLATTGGNVTISVNGKPVKVGINCYVPFSPGRIGKPAQKGAGSFQID